MPVLLAGVYSVFGHDVDAARVLNALLGVAAVALLYLLVARLFDRRTALLAAALAAVAPSLVFLGGGLLSENLFIPLVLATAALVAWQRDRGGWAIAAAAGAVLGLAVLTRTNGLLLVIPARPRPARGSPPSGRGRRPRPRARAVDGAQPRDVRPLPPARHAERLHDGRTVERRGGRPG